MKMDDKNRHRMKKEIFEWIIIFMAAVAAVFLLDTQVIVNAYIPSGSMKNTIEPGDHIMGSRLAYRSSDPQRFDIIIFRFPDNREDLYIKRIIGLPNETVRIVNGEIYINDSEKPLNDPFSTELGAGSCGTYVIPDDSYFVMGDNRNDSFDSRFWKNPFVQKEDILGKAVARYWPVRRAGIVK